MSISSTAADDEDWVYEDPDCFVDARDVLGLGAQPPVIELAELEASGAAHSAAMNELEGITLRARELIAEEYLGIANVLRDAAARPDPWVGPDPTQDPAWRDPQDRPAWVMRAERRNIAVRSAAMDLAARLGMSEMMVRTRAGHTDTLRERCPRVWAAFRAGRVLPQNADTAAQQAASPPARAKDA